MIERLIEFFQQWMEIGNRKKNERNDDPIGSNRLEDDSRSFDSLVRIAIVCELIENILFHLAF
ncbi:hypothetical protein EFP84_17535 [Leptospira kmetyi]|uniref:Uncharacterized protein n=1 Tax=Leptospira kmetyi TaxID=408139 RepID=A0AAD0UVP0_9LEPT|nr:hypothetical protein EFP84_17535 [Leptospira kmetyi]